MLKISIEDAQLQRNLRQLADRDARQAVVWALNDTADDILTHVSARMDEVFDRRIPLRAFPFRHPWRIACPA